MHSHVSLLSDYRPYDKALSEENKKKAAYYELAARCHDLETRISAAKQYTTPTSQQDIAKLQGELEKTKAQRAKAKASYEEKVANRRGITESYKHNMTLAFQKLVWCSCCLGAMFMR